MGAIAKDSGVSLLRDNYESKLVRMSSYSVNLVQPGLKVRSGRFNS